MMLLKELLRDVNRKIVEAEMRSTARATGLMSLLRDDVDTTEQDRLFWDDMRALGDLRHERHVLTEALERPDLPASAEHLLNLVNAKLDLILEARLRLQGL